MSDPRALTKIHTFADDLAAARQARGIVAPVESAKPPTAKTGDAGKPETIAPSGPIKLRAAASRDASYPALVITDQKRKKLGLTEAIGSGISAWWNEQLSRVSTKKKPPAYVSPASALDKGKTSVRSARDVVSPQQEIAAKLRAAEKAPIKAPAQTKTIAPTPAASTDGAWDTGIVLEEPAVPAIATAVVDTVIPVAKEEVVTTETTPISRILPTIPTIVERAPEEEIETEEDDTEPFVLFEDDDYDEEVVEEVPTPEPLIPSPISRPKITPAIPVAAAVPAPEPVALRPLSDRLSAVTQLRDEEVPTMPSTLRGDSDIASLRREQVRQVGAQLPATPSRTGASRLLQFWPYAGAFLFVALTAGTIGYFVMSTSSTTDTTDVTTSFPDANIDGGSGLPTGPNTATMSAQLDAPNRSSLYSVIMNSQGSGESLFMVTPLAHDTALPLKPSEILLLINRALPPDFTGNITGVELGSYRDSPVIILTVADETRVRGGLFAWEETLSNDLSPWFGTPLRKTASSTPSFSDSTVSGRDVRILKDDLGTDRITYGFVNGAQVVITKNSESFLNIASTLPSY
jgi:hypothetical protein